MTELSPVLIIAKSLLPPLISVAKDELLLWYHSKTELEKLENTITTIRDVLHDAEQRQATDAAVQRWISRLRDEMYKADDLFDSISTRALQKRAMSGNQILKETRLFLSKSNQVAFVAATAHKVKELREQLDAIAKDMIQFGFLKRSPADVLPVFKRKAPSHSYIPADEFIGREKEEEDILRLLLKEDPGVELRVSVIAVVGIGGQGKTSLAQKLYNAVAIDEFFNFKRWACVNDFSNLKEVLEEVTARKTHSLDELQNLLRKEIQGKRFLLVLDDVWDDNRERWLGLKRLLDAGDRGSKVLITTRVTTVAQNLATVIPYYTLGGLSDEHAWLLFKKVAFDIDQEEVDQDKEELGMQIVKKCANVPLAIRAIGSYLFRKDKKQWSELVHNPVMNAMRDDSENGLLKVLKISYDDLPSSLKHCFVYCALFPEDYKFDKNTLIHLWMAQGFLQTSDENELLEDVGERYFQYLTERCFFQNIYEDYFGLIKCKMHDLFHTLAVKIAGKECIEMKKCDTLEGKSPRHLLVKNIEGLSDQGKGIRTLVSPMVGLVEGSVLDGVFRNFTSLRTLSLQRLDTEEIPSSICKLIHLRYLDLTDSEKLKMLPSTLCNLQNLLILRLGGCKNLIELPDDIHKLVSLRYMETEGCSDLNHMPSRLEEMTSLVMLDRLVVSKDQGGLRCLKRLNNLTGALHIELSRGMGKNCVADAEESMLSCKTKLSKLHISFKYSKQGEEADTDALLDRLQPSNHISDLHVEYFPGVKFPDWLSSMVNLVNLELIGCNSCVELPHLSLLCHLKRLTLGCIPLLEYVMNDIRYDGGDQSFFPSLEKLVIFYMQSLKRWWRQVYVGGEVSYVGQLCFTRLSNLYVEDCPELSCFPRCPSLESLTLKRVNVKLVTQLVRELEANNSPVPPSSSSLSLTSAFPALCYLDISDCPDMKLHSLFCSLQYLPCLESLTFVGFSSERELYVDEDWEKEGMPWMSLTRLKSLDFEFGNDSQGAHLLKGLHHLTMLDSLNFHKKVPNDIDTQWAAPPNLKFLNIQGMDKVGCLNRVIQRLAKIQFLELKSCKFDEDEWDNLPWEDLKGLRALTFSLCNVKSLPENNQLFPALEDLRIICCNELTCLPMWVSQLTSLDIDGFNSVLKERCRKPTGSYWPLIQDIPHLTIDLSEG